MSDVRAEGACRRATVALLVATLACAACAGYDTSRRPRSHPLRAAPSDLEQESHPPMRQVVLGLLNLPPELARAEAKLVSRCMRAHGYERRARLPLRSSSNGPGERTLSGVATPITVEDARARGYGALLDDSRGPTSGHVEARRRGYLDALDHEHGPQARVRMAGMVVGASKVGCLADARREIYGSVRTYLRLEYLPQLVRRFTSGALEADAVEAARAAYEVCMSSAGYARARSPAHAVDLARSRFSRRRHTSAEHAMASTDAGCQRTSGVYDALDEAVWHAATGWVERQRGDLRTLHVRRRAAIRRAGRALERAR